jgi:hypothetical protein
MSAILPCLAIDSDAKLLKHFMPHQLNWIDAEEQIHALGKQAFAFAEKAVRIGWTYADGFKNVRKRLRFKKRHYLFATKDWPSALEYMNQVYEFAEFFNLTGTIVSHGEESLQVPRLDPDGRESAFTEEVKIGSIKFDNGSRIIAFSSNPQAMAVYGGDVGLDEFAKHRNAKLLWQTAQGRVALGHDATVWSSHDGEDTLFNEFAQLARAGKGPWNLYYRVTLPDALDSGLLDLVNRLRPSLPTSSNSSFNGFPCAWPPPLNPPPSPRTPRPNSGTCVTSSPISSPSAVVNLSPAASASKSSALPWPTPKTSRNSKNCSGNGPGAPTSWPNSSLTATPIKPAAVSSASSIANSSVSTVLILMNPNPNPLAISDHDPAWPPLRLIPSYSELFRLEKNKKPQS